MPRIRAAHGWITLVPTLLLGGLFLARAPADGTGAPIAVIVHEQVPVDDLSLPELQRIFLGKRLFWSQDLTIILLVPARGTSEREVLLAKIYERRSEVEYQHYWINKLFGSGAQTAPKITGSPQMSASLVRGIPGAIALVPVNRIPNGVKVLRIDGKLPGEAGYPLMASG